MKRTLAQMVFIAAVAALVVSCGSEPSVRLDVTPMADAPIADRNGAVSVWTGTEAIFWGGSLGDKVNAEYYTDGAAYDPTTDSWREIAPAPLEARTHHAAAWTGDEMIVFGGINDEFDVGSTVFLDAAAYDPSTDSWRSLPDAPADLLGADVPALANQPGLVGEDQVFFLGGNGLLTFDLTTELWETYEGIEVNFGASRLTRHGDLLVMATDTFDPIGTSLIEIDPSSGVPTNSGTLAVGGVGTALVSLADDRLAVIVNDNNTTKLLSTDDSYEVLATADANSFSTLTDQGLIVAGDWIVSAQPAEVGLLSRIDSSFSSETLDRDSACALGSNSVWTGEVLVGWNGTACEFQIDNSQQFEAITGGIVVDIQTPS